MSSLSLVDYLAGKKYPGRTIAVYTDLKREYLHFIYFIMGRSANSQNRIFVYQNGQVQTEAFDKAKLEDPSLIIYPVYKAYQGTHIVTNGDQTETIFQGLKQGIEPQTALLSRDFEPDAPNFTPRISAVFSDDQYALNIIKACDAEGSASLHFNFVYPLQKGVGHCIHTYIDDGEPLPSFAGEPFSFQYEEQLAEKVWQHIYSEYKISLLHLTIKLTDQTLTDYQIFNKHEMEGHI